MTGVTPSYTGCNGWTHMLLDVTGQMRYCCRRSRCFLISDTSSRPRARFFSFSLASFVLREIPTGSEKYPLLRGTSEKHYHMLSRNAPASCQKVQQTKEPYEKRFLTPPVPAIRKFPTWSICLRSAICQVLRHKWDKWVDACSEKSKNEDNTGPLYWLRYKISLFKRQ